MALTIVFEDDRLLALCKPVGQAAVPGRGNIEEPLSREAGRHTGGKLFIAHRLDRDTSGLIVFAKDAATHRELCLLFENRQVHKTYLALVQGRVEKDGVVEKPIRTFGSGRMGCGVGGKPSLTRYRVKRRFEGATMLEVEPTTGRRHQIRVHLCAIGHPVMGDRLYGRNRPVGGAGRLMLHALQIEAPGLPLLRAEPGADFNSNFFKLQT